MRRTALIGIVVGVLTVFGLYFLGSEGAPTDPPARGEPLPSLDGGGNAVGGGAGGNTGGITPPPPSQP